LPSINPEPIPEELKERDQWLLWDARNDRPRQPHWKGDFGISWSDPDDWHSFAEALAAAQKRDSWGIGYVMALDNDAHGRGLYGCLDLDGCLNGPESPTDWLPSLEWAITDGAYVERSPSGDGLHIPLYNPDVPDWWADSHFSADEHEGVELLTNKFVTFTGDQLGDTHDGVTAADPTEFLYKSYDVLNGEAPRDPTADSGGDYDGDLDRELVEEMLSHVDNGCAYPDWRDILFAINDWDSGQQGKRVAKRWSRGAAKYDDDAERLIDSIWSRETTPSDPITVGTLFHHAQQGGWEPPQPQGRERAETVEELVARYSEEYDDPAEVPDDVLDSGESVADETAADAGESDGGEQPGSDWDTVYQAYCAAEDAEERKPARHAAAQQLLEDGAWHTVQSNDVLWRYDAQTGIYRDNGESKVRELLGTHLKEQYRTHEQKEILAKLRSQTTVQADALGGPAGMICCENCVIEVREDEIIRHEHSPDYDFMGRVQTVYDPDAECPEFEAFLDDVMPADERGADRKKLQEFAGYTLLHWALPHHKALFLVGPTASGKSTFLDTIRTMLGQDAVSSLTPQQMTGEQFGGAELRGSWANIRNDIPDSLIENTGQFKEIVAGDPIKAERKFKDPFMFEPTAKHLFSANSLPEPSTDDDAFFRRVMLIAFRHQIPRDERDPHLDDKLQAEHPGLLNWCLEGLQRLMRQGGFTAETPPWQTEQTWEKWADSVKRFKRECLDDTGDSFVQSDAIFGVYREFCEREGIPEMVAQGQLVHELSQRFEFERDRQYADGDRRRGLAYCEFTEHGEQLLDDVTN